MLRLFTILSACSLTMLVLLVWTWTLQDNTYVRTVYRGYTPAPNEKVVYSGRSKRQVETPLQDSRYVYFVRPIPFRPALAITAILPVCWCISAIFRLVAR